MAKIKTLLITLLIFNLLLVVARLPSARAQISSCSVSVSPTQMDINTTGNLTFSITNNDSSSVQWVKISISETVFDTLSATSVGWLADVVSPTEVVFEFGSLGGSSSADFNLFVQTGTTTGDYSWTVEVSDDSGGSNPTTCGGSTTITLLDPNDNTPPVISNISVGSITTSAATITWETDEDADSAVDYGTTNAYGSTESDSGSVTSHSIELTGLTDDTTYHYRIRSSDAANNEATSADATFTTDAATASPTPTPTSSSSSSSSSSPTPTPTSTPSPTSTPTSTPVTTSATPVPTPEPEPVDNIPPTVSLSTDFSQPFSSPPTILGQASDESGVVSVEYSLDDGINWLPTNFFNGLARPAVNFSFTPRHLDDGNFSIRARATDAAGNRGLSPTYTLVFDQLPPLAGVSVVSVGPQVITPASDGSYFLTAGLPYTVTLDAVGGPIEATVVLDASDTSPTFSLSRRPESGLWSGEFFTEEVGEYHAEAKLLDGAGNSTSTKIGNFIIQPTGQAIDQNGLPIEQATVTAYYLDSSSQLFTPWDGRPYQQANPVSTDQDGRYHMFLPPGTYYLLVEAANHRPLVTNIFSLNTGQSISANFTLEKTLLYFSRAQTTIEFPQFTQSDALAGLIDTPIPFVTLQEGDSPVASTSLRGQPTVITLLASWLPQTAEQLPVLQDFSSNNPGVNVAAVFVQESGAKTSVLKRRSNYTFSLLADPTGGLTEALQVHAIPTHIFLSPSGLIKNIKVGVLSEAEILNYLSS